MGRMSALRRSGEDRRRDEAWATALQHAFDCMLSEDDGRARPRPRVLAVSPNGLEVEIELRWLNSQRYCCAERGCFLATDSRAWWATFREALTEVNDREPAPLSVRVLGVVEDGVLLTYLEQVGLPAQSRAYVYGPAEDHERDAR